MDLKEYAEKARQYAVYQDDRYPMYALVEEVGELTGLFAKMLRGDYEWPPRDKLVKELGDCFWNACILASDDELERAQNLLSNTKAGHFEIIRWICFDVSDYVGFKFPRSLIDLITSLNCLVGCLDLNLDEILQTNLDKLESRQARGQIKGSGDER